MKIRPSPALRAHGRGACRVLGQHRSTQRKIPRGRPDARPALCVDRVRYVGDPVAMVIAESIAQAKDAAEAIEVDYEPLPSVTATEAATETALIELRLTLMVPASVSSSA